MINRISSYFYLFRSDPIFRKKVFFIFTVTILSVLLLSFIIWVNTQNRDFIVGNNSVSAPNQNQNPVRTVTSNDFSSESGLVEIISRPIGQLSPMLNSSGRWIMMSDDQRLMINGEIVEDSPQISPLSLYRTNEGVIINEVNRSSRYVNNRYENFDEGVSQVVPAFLPDPNGQRSIPGYLYIQKIGQSVNIFQKETLDDLQASTLVGAFQPSPPIGYLELRIIDGEPYIFNFPSLTRNGEVQVWKILRNNTIKQLETLIVESMTFGENGIFLQNYRTVQNDLTLYNYFIYTPNKLNDTFEAREVDITSRMAQRDIFGAITSDRCSLTDENELACLVKQERVLSHLSEYNDKIIFYSPEQNRFDILSDQLFFSGSKILAKNRNELFIVSQINRQLYSLNAI